MKSPETSPFTPSRFRIETALLAALFLAMPVGLAAPFSAQSFESHAQNPGDPAFAQLPYVVLFVATEGHANSANETPPHFGLDVISASNPSAHGPAGGLYALLPDGSVEKLFPLPHHESISGLIDTPQGLLHKGAVVEPNVSEDGRTVYFSYFHDAKWKPNSGGYQNLKISYKGADLYRLDVGPLVDDPSTDPTTLAVKRLTFKQYAGPPKNNVSQTVADRNKDALNPGLATTFAATAYWGTINMHMIELRTQEGLKALFVSNRARIANSNEQVGDANHNFNLYTADILPDGSLGPAEQTQFYTTTSALSPMPLRNGYAFSYQSSTNEVRRWDIQAVDSEGRWKPLLGYAHGSELFHLGSLVVDIDGQGNPKDWFVGLKYYHFNDGGFGNLHRVPVADAGTNVFRQLAWGVSPRQTSNLLTLGVSAADGPSPKILVGGQLRFVGKFSSPRAGRIGGEYLMSYTETSANRWLLDADGNKGIWEAYITYRPNLTPFGPHDPIDPVSGTGLYTVVRDTTNQYDLIWPTPLLTWKERTGDRRQRLDPPIIPAKTSIRPGEPFARVGTSSVWNTDVRPFDCYLGNGGRPFNPNTVNGNEDIAVLRSQDGLRYVPDPNDFCKYLSPAEVLGIRINLTSNRTDLSAMYNRGYESDGGKQKEAVTRLGFYSVVDENQADQSFQARIPADAPFDFHLMDRKYGMKLVDVRSWHSLKPRETRNDCGGCHQHEAGFGIPFAGTEAAFKPPLDFTDTTPVINYDAACKPVVQTMPSPAEGIPEWVSDIWPGFDQHCGSCHNAIGSNDVAALAAYDYVDEKSAYTRMKQRNFANSDLGALGSPIFWAAYGERTDGRINSLPEYTPNYLGGVWGYRFSAIHATSPGLCSAANPTWANWVRDLGLWIDNHMPRDTGTSAYGFDFDRFHPTADMALTEPTRLRIGYWDDTGTVSLTLALNGTTLLNQPALSNGSFVVSLPPWVQLGDTIEITVEDATGNRRKKSRTRRQLVDAFGTRGKTPFEPR